MTVKQAADRLGVSPQIVYGSCASRLLRHSRIGLGRGEIAISEEPIAEYLKGREVGPANAEPPPSPSAVG